jgi:hypothetical protein
MNVTREIEKLTGRELAQGTSLDSSWHNDYRDTAWLFIGNLPQRLTEGDVLCVFSQFGEIEDINLARDAATGKRKGMSSLGAVERTKSECMIVFCLDLASVLLCMCSVANQAKQYWYVMRAESK